MQQVKSILWNSRLSISSVCLKKYVLFRLVPLSQKLKLLFKVTYVSFNKSIQQHNLLILLLQKKKTKETDKPKATKSQTKAKPSTSKKKKEK